MMLIDEPLSDGGRSLICGCLCQCHCAQPAVYVCQVPHARACRTAGAFQHRPYAYVWNSACACVTCLWLTVLFRSVRHN